MWLTPFRRPPGLLPDVDVGEPPGLALVEGYLGADHLAAAAGVRVPLDGVGGRGGGEGEAGQGGDGGGGRRGHGR